MRIANIQHLATPIRAQLAAPMDALELAGLMHPTPAVGGEPLDAAAPLIPALEGLDRGWYAGPVGWTDATGDGEFCVALRCALLRRRRRPLLRRQRHRARLRPGRASSPRPRSSCRRCCRCSRAERRLRRVARATALHTRRCSAHVRGAVAADLRRSSSRVAARARARARRAARRPSPTRSCASP